MLTSVSGGCLARRDAVGWAGWRTSPRAGARSRGEPLGTSELCAVHELTERVASGDPGRIAVCGDGIEISYGELIVWADRIRAGLAARGVGIGSRVGIVMVPSVAMVAAALAVRRCGAAYVPVNPAHPDARMLDILADAQVTATVCDKASSAG